METERFAALDFETANGTRSSVCSVGIVLVEKGEITDRIYRLIRPNPNFYMPWTTRIHGLTPEDTREADRFPVVWKEIAPLIEGVPLIAHYSLFDEGCLRAVFERYQMEYPGYPFYCTCRLARKYYKELPNHKLSTVAAHCGYNLLNHHHALADAEACAHISLALLEKAGVSRLSEL